MNTTQATDAEQLAFQNVLKIKTKLDDHSYVVKKHETDLAAIETRLAKATDAETDASIELEAALKKLFDHIPENDEFEKCRLYNYNGEMYWVTTDEDDQVTIEQYEVTEIKWLIKNI